VVLADADGKPLHGLELKLVSSFWTARGVHYDLQPKSDHLIQSALYSWLLRQGDTPLPYTLLYSSRVQWHLSTAPKWLQQKFKPGCYDVEFKEDGSPFKVLPFNRAYTLTWVKDRLHYHTDGLKAPVATAIDMPSIWRYYHAVSQLGPGKALPPRPTPLGVDGSKSYNPCDYCPLAPVCDQHTDYQTWHDHATLTLKSDSQTQVSKEAPK
jgi:hypothetical protein